MSSMAPSFIIQLVHFYSNDMALKENSCRTSSCLSYFFTCLLKLELWKNDILQRVRITSHLLSRNASQTNWHNADSGIIEGWWWFSVTFCHGKSRWQKLWYLYKIFSEASWWQSGLKVDSYTSPMQIYLLEKGGWLVLYEENIGWGNHRIKYILTQYTITPRWQDGSTWKWNGITELSFPGSIGMKEAA